VGDVVVKPPIDVEEISTNEEVAPEPETEVMQESAPKVEMPAKKKATVELETTMAKVPSSTSGFSLSEISIEPLKIEEPIAPQLEIHEIEIAPLAFEEPNLELEFQEPIIELGNPEPVASPSAIKEDEELEQKSGMSATPSFRLTRKEGAILKEVEFGKEPAEPRTVWVDSWRDLPREKETIGADAPSESIKGYYDEDTNTIYAIKGVTTEHELEHEKYHQLKKHTETTDPRQFTREELEAEKYAFDKLGKDADFLSTLRAILNDLTIYSYKLKPQEALGMMKEEFDKVNPPESWYEDFKQLEDETAKAYGVVGADHQAIGLDKVELPQYRTPKTKVYEVNGEYVRDNYNIDYTMGGSWKTYPKFIPKHEYWIERQLDTVENGGTVEHPLVDRQATLLHELTETDAMGKARGKGKVYGDAHTNVANVAEAEGRKHPDKLEGMIQAFLDRYRTKGKKITEPIVAEEMVEPESDALSEELVTAGVEEPYQSNREMADRIDAVLGLDMLNGEELLPPKPSAFASSKRERKADELLDTFAGVESNKSESAEKLVNEDNEPVEVVPSYVRRRKKPKNLKNWWESASYGSPPKPKEVAIHERTYYGHRLLPPELGISLSE